MFTAHAEFNYEAPQMTYDKKTGEVTITDPAEERKKRKKRIITNTDDMENRAER